METFFKVNPIFEVFHNDIFYLCNKGLQDHLSLKFAF